jgi:hypothetical protein
MFFQTARWSISQQGVISQQRSPFLKLYLQINWNSVVLFRDPAVCTVTFSVKLSPQYLKRTARVINEMLCVCSPFVAAIFWCNIHPCIPRMVRCWWRVWGRWWRFNMLLLELILCTFFFYFAGCWIHFCGMNALARLLNVFISYQRPRFRAVIRCLQQTM